MTNPIPFAVDPAAEPFAFRASINDPRFLERSVSVRLDDSAIDGRSMFGLVSTDTLTGSTSFYTANASTCTGYVNSILAVDFLYAVPFIMSNGFGVQAVAFSVTTGGAAGAVARCGIYDCQDDLNGNLYPNRLLADGGQQDTTTTGFKSTTLALLLKEGRVYWMVYHPGVNAATVSSLPPMGVDAILGSRAAAPPVRATHVKVARAYAALPITFPSGGSTGTAAPPALLYAFTRPSSTVNIRVLPMFHPASTGSMVRRVRLLKGDTLRVTDPGRPYVILRAMTRGSSGARSVGVFDSRTNGLMAGTDFRMNHEDVDFQMSVADEVVMQIEQYGYPKVSLRDTTGVVDYVYTGGG